MKEIGDFNHKSWFAVAKTMERAEVEIEPGFRCDQSESPLTASNSNPTDLQMQKTEMLRIIGKLGLSRFKSPGQEELVRHVLFEESSVLGVLPTGGGKSLAIFSSLHSRVRKLTIAIFPLIAVLGDVKERLERLVENRHLPQHR